MAGFEVVVRPAVLPDIRPPPARSLPIEDAPDKGIAVINGVGNAIVDLTYSSSSSWSRSRLVEIIRTYDKVRIYAGNTDGTIDYSSYIEVEVLTGLQFLENGQEVIGQAFAQPYNFAGMSVIETGLTRRNPNV